MNTDEHIINQKTPETQNIHPSTPYSPALGYTLLTLANILGISSLLMWGAFVFWGGLNIISSRGISETRILIFDACLSLAFFIQHSIMPRQWFQKWLSKHLHKDLHGAIFTICTGLPLLAVTILWLKSDNVMVQVNGVFRYLMHLVFFLGAGCFYWGVKSLGTFDIFGIGTIPKRLKGEQLPPDIPFTVRGPYCFVRHPLYFGVLLMIWSCPNLTSDRLLHNILWTVWIVIATIFEEWNLKLAFGEDYEKYQKTVPMLIPWKVFARK
jgi:protein-S-isoprenylcysteine O-methyltransferase Ste14